jgi:hypothetical protein
MTARRPSTSPWLVGLLTLVLGVILALRVLIPNDMDATVFIALGEDSRIQTTYAQRLLGDVATRDNLGHDGKFFFAQANDPWYLEPERNAVVLDRPIYRAQRMLYPVIAGGFGSFPPNVVVWAMLITNLLALAVGAYLAARLAVAWGGSAWLGLWVPLNVGLLFELDIGGSGILAYACCLAALLAMTRDRIWLASALFAAGALSRETMVAFAAGVALLWWLDRRRILWQIVAAPLAAMAVWTAYLLVRLEGLPGIRGGTKNFGPPFLGLFEAIRSWLHHPIELFMSVVLLSVVVAFVPLAVRGGLPIAWGALPFVALVIVTSANVLGEPSNLSRALAPIFTAFPFVILVGDRSRSSRTPEVATEGSA